MRKLIALAAVGCSLLLATPVMAETPSDGVSPTYQQALAAWEANDWVVAEERLRAVVAQDSKHYDAHLKLGGIYLTSQRIDEAVDAFQKAIGINSQDSLGFTALSLAYLHKGAYAPARAAAESAAELAPQEEGPKKLLAFIDARIDQGGKLQVAHP